MARDAATGRVFVGATGRDVNVALRFDEGAWTGAWRAIYATSATDTAAAGGDV